MEKTRTILYKTLKESKKIEKEIKDIIRRYTSKDNPSLEAMERGLIVLIEPENQTIESAYNVDGYLTQDDYNVYEVEFRRERKVLEPEEVLQRISKGVDLEKTVKLNGKGLVVLEKPIFVGEFNRLIPRHSLPIEEYLFYEGAFPTLKEAYEKAS